MGQIYLKTNKYNNAIESFKKCIAGKGGSLKPILEAWAHNLLGNCYDIKGMRELAIAEYKKVIDMDVTYDGAVDFARKYLKKSFKNL